MLLASSLYPIATKCQQHDSAIKQTNTTTLNKTAPPISPFREPADERIANYTKWLTRFTGLLVLVGAFQFFFVIRADKTARIRPEVSEIVIRNGREALRLNFKNWGLTPAQDFHAWIGSAIREMPLREPLLPMPEGGSKVGTYPVSPGHIIQKEIPFPVETPEATTAIKGGEAAIYIFGRADYRDVFGEDRYTEFCFYLADDPPRKLVFYSGGNRST